MKEDDKNSQSAKKQSSNDLSEEKTLKDVIQEQAREDESPLASRLSLRKILGGDILYAQALRKQIGLMLLITFFLILYISFYFLRKAQETALKQKRKEKKTKMK